MSNKQISTQQPPTTNSHSAMLEKDFLSSAEAAAYLGISLNQLYKLNAVGGIPSYRPTGGKIYYRKTDLMEWILSCRRATIKDIKSQTIKSLNFKN